MGVLCIMALLSIVCQESCVMSLISLQYSLQCALELPGQVLQEAGISIGTPGVRQSASIFNRGTQSSTLADLRGILASKT